MYKIELSPAAKSTYEWLDKHDSKLLSRIDAALDAIAHDPFSVKRLRGEFHGEHSYRVGNYRIIYRVVRDRLFVYVLDIGHRREIYRR